ncbi:MAG: hypothetical protein ACFB9M_04675 [Myxococcota bacterium]
MISWMRILAGDGLRVLRDQFLVAALLYVLVTAAAIGFSLSPLRDWVEQRYAFPLEDHYPLFSAYFGATLGGLAVGSVGGFLLVESKVERAFDVLRVSQIGVGAHLLVQCSVAWLIASLLILVLSFLVSPTLPGTTAWIFGAVVSALLAPTTMLFIGAFAEDQMEAFAAAKLVGLIGLAPVAAWFLPEPWSLGLGLLPHVGAIYPWWGLSLWWCVPSLLAFLLAIEGLRRTLLHRILSR